MVFISLSGYLIVYRKGCFFELTDVGRDDKRTEGYDQEVEDVREVDSWVLAGERCCGAQYQADDRQQQQTPGAQPQ